MSGRAFYLGIFEREGACLSVCLLFCCIRIAAEYSGISVGTCAFAESLGSSTLVLRTYFWPLRLLCISEKRVVYLCKASSDRHLQPQTFLHNVLGVCRK